MKRAAENRTVLLKLLAVTVLMFGFGYALVPLYKKICEVTGINELGRTSCAAGEYADRHGPLADDRVRCQSAQRSAMAVSAAADQCQGASGRAGAGHVRSAQHFRQRPITGQAIPSYGPQVAGQFVRKLDCFCFAKQSFAPGEVRQMPVVLSIGSGLPKDVSTVTLSYTFFEVEGAAPAAVAPTDRTPAGGLKKVR